MNKHCCEVLDQILAEGRAYIGYSSKYREYYIDRRKDPMGSYDLSYCPWCGKEFPSSLRDEWFELLEKEYGLDDPWSLEQEKLVPQEFTTDEWWTKTRL